jgi:hypothetical protein
MNVIKKLDRLRVHIYNFNCCICQKGRIQIRQMKHYQPVPDLEAESDPDPQHCIQWEVFASFFYRSVLSKIFQVLLEETGRIFLLYYESTPRVPKSNWIASSQKEVKKLISQCYRFNKNIKVWWQLPLFLFLFIYLFSYIHNHIHTIHSFIFIRRGLHLLFSSLLVSLRGKNLPGVPGLSAFFWMFRLKEYRFSILKFGTVYPTHTIDELCRYRCWWWHAWDAKNRQHQKSFPLRQTKSQFAENPRAELPFFVHFYRETNRAEQMLTPPPPTSQFSCCWCILHLHCWPLALTCILKSEYIADTCNNLFYIFDAFLKYAVMVSITEVDCRAVSDSNAEGTAAKHSEANEMTPSK